MNKKLISNHTITYNGILISAIKLLRKNQISSFYKKYYQMIIIDEFQDTNLLGYLLIKKLIGDNVVIF
ncbi:UvrD-helicase domain-containing protein [[Ruminococcus] torques]|nr:UvrD-helicase domain-containing protein [[Ruminococcus] torques]